MAPVFILMGSIIGFFSAILCYTVLDTSLLAALAIWIGSGPVSALLLVLSPRNGATPAPQTQGLAKAA